VKLSRLLLPLLCFSLAANLALLLRGRQDRAPENGAPLTAAAASSSSPALSAGQGSTAATDQRATALALRAALASPDLQDLRGLLESSGVEPKLRQALLITALHHRYEERFRALNPDLSATMLREWWRNPDAEEQTFGRGSSGRDRILAHQKIQRELEAEIASLTGEDAAGLDPDNNAWLARRYSGLAPERAKALREIERDYEELEQEVHLSSGGFQLPSDQEKLRLLHEERERDIAALLSPEERVEWELRASPTADRAREHATRFRASEEEYRRIYALQKKFDAEYEFDPFAAAPRETDWQARSAAEKELERGIREIIGEERHRAAKRSQDPDFFIARAAAERLGLPPAQVDQALTLRDETVAASRRVAADRSLDAAAKKAALARLAAEGRAGLERSFGPEATQVMIERGGMAWLKALQEGSALEPDDNSPDGLRPRPLAEEGEATLIRID
jgi:hypothetical protein